jgi:hypothetical protein
MHETLVWEEIMRVRNLAGVVLGAAGLLLFGAQALAHHSFAAEFDADKKVSLTGIVTKVQWTNPHVWFYINVENAETGEVTNWGAEMGPPHGLQRRGWRRESLQIGTQVTVNGYAARNGSKRLSARDVTLTATGNRPGETLDAASSKDDDANPTGVT